MSGSALDISSHADRLIFPSEVVRDSFLDLTGAAKGVPEIMPQGLYKTSLLSRPAGDGGLRARLGIPDRARLVINMGFSDLRKGIDRFITTAMTICAERDDVWFIWVGATSLEASAWHMPDVARAGLADRIRLTGAWEEDVGQWYAAADVFFLSSREDPFPSVVMEALAMGLPVVGYEGTGGCDRLIQRHGRLVNATDPLAAAGAITALLDAAPEMRRMATARRRAEIAANYRFDNYCFELLRRFKPGLAKVSVVVPNYNYQRYIGARLASIFDQTLPVFETIVLDDASPDASLNEIRKVAEAHQRSIDLVVNEVNSGSPFPQWRKGVTRATGDYVWIAEADDLADPGFLATLAKRMAQTGAAIGFCDSRQIDENGDRLGDSYKPYLNEIEPGRFDTAFDMAGQEFLSRFLSVKNVILNVSGVLFHREVLAAAIDAVGPGLDLFGVAGDWRLYIEICAMGGRVVYEPAALNSHRRHSISVTHALKVGRHLEEVEAMQMLAMMTVNIDPGTRMAQKQHMDAAKKYLGVA